MHAKGVQTAPIRRVCCAPRARGSAMVIVHHYVALIWMRGGAGMLTSKFNGQWIVQLSGTCATA